MLGIFFTENILVIEMNYMGVELERELLHY